MKRGTGHDCYRRSAQMKNIYIICTNGANTNRFGSTKLQIQGLQLSASCRFADSPAASIAISLLLQFFGRSVV